MSTKLKRGLIAIAAIAVLAAGGAAIAGATGSGDDGEGTPITGTNLDKAKQVALQHAGGGTVTGTEIRDEEGYYEVEIHHADGTGGDVHLDRNFNVIDDSTNQHGDQGQ